MAKQDSQHFPDLYEFTDEEMRANGYTRRCVSVFDHWLTEEEASQCRLFDYEQAVASGLQCLYVDQERRLLGFYKDLFAHGAIRRTRLGARYIGIASHERWDRRLKSDVSRSLRNRGHMDAYVPELKLRVLGNWDRTDVLLFEDGSPTDQVERLATKHGLFLL